MIANDQRTWDFFLAYAGPDKATAEELHELLRRDARVFVDSRCLLYGDDWDQAIAAAQTASAITVVLISSKTDSAYYQREEIAAAVAMARQNSEQHRVIPVYLDDKASSNSTIPYGLRIKHGLTVFEQTNIASVAHQLLDLLKRLGDSGVSSATVPAGSSPTSRLPSVVDYYCYISRSKVDQLLAASAEFRVDKVSQLDRAEQAVDSVCADIDDLTRSDISYGRPDLLQRGAEEKREYALRLRELLRQVGPTVRQFRWEPDTEAHSLYRLSESFRVSEIQDEHLMASIVARRGDQSLVLHCSLSNFSHTTVYQGKPRFQSTNYGFFTSGIPVLFDSVFLLLSSDRHAFYGSPIYLKLPMMQGLAL
jgi:TIR domain